MPEIIYTKVAGVTFRNPDGHSRQEMIRRFVLTGDEVFLERVPTADHPNAIALFVLTDDDSIGEDGFAQIGFLNEKRAAEIKPLLDAGQIVSASVANITGEEQDTLGVNLELRIYSPEESAELNRKTSEAISAAEAKMKAQRSAQQPMKKVKRKSSKNIIVLLLLWFFLGYLGVHRWYAGRGSWLYTLTLGYLLIGWIVDFFVIVLGQFKDSRGLPVTWSF
jgi:hypothetical protein